MASRKRFLTRGFFPKELPPAFRSAQYARAIENSAYAPVGFPALPRAELCNHSLSRVSGVRRLISIPNPICHFRLADEISQGWDDLRIHLMKSEIAVSRPVLTATMGRAAGPRARFGALPRIRVRRRRHGKYVLVADVAEYYRTVYTHSIPWALHTKAVAHVPSNFNNTTLLGVRMDRALRNTQGLQTNGIPIGPDTSFVIGEIILAAVDMELMTSVRPISALRYYDDYELVFERYSDAEEALAALHSALATYNLQLNAQKTQINSLPMQFDNPWRGPLRSYAFGQTDEARQRLLLTYFDLVFSLKRDYPSDAVVGYAMSRLESLDFEAGSWSVLQDLLLQTMSVEPDSLQQIAVMFVKAQSDGHTINVEALREAITLLIRQHAPQGHGSEIAWGLWMALSFGCKIDDAQALQSLSKMYDSPVALLALDAYNRGLLPNLDLTYWSSLITSAQLYGEHWLLSYEARVRGWMPTVGGGDHVAADPAFNFLNSSGVRFYQTVRTPNRHTTATIPNWRPTYGTTDLMEL